MAALNPARRLLLACLAAGLLLPCAGVDGATANEQQVKAVFVYNFSHFVDWPPVAFNSASEPFVIGVLGGAPFATVLEEVVRGERVNSHPIQVRRFSSIGDLAPCQILFIDKAEAAQVEQVVAFLRGRGTLTVTDLEDATQRGVMIQLANIGNRIRLRINADSARANGLILSSNLLRSAEIVRTVSLD